METVNPTLSFDQITSAVESVIQKEQDIHLSDKSISTVSNSVNDILEALKANEDGDAWIFINLQKNCYRFDHSLGKWFKWNGHYWKEDDIGHVYSALDCVVDQYSQEYDRQSILRKRAASQQSDNEEKKAANLQKELLRRIHDLQGVSRKKNVLFLAAQGESSLGISGNEWDRHPTLLGCENGVLDLTTGDFRSGKPEEYIKTISPIEWKGIGEPAHIWEKFLGDIFEGQQELISYIQRFLGYVITGSVRDHVIVVFWGAKGRNGKGTLFETLKFILGPVIDPINIEMLTGDYKNRSSAAPSPDIMSLRGRRLVWASEAEEGHEFAVGKIKLLTGADTLTGRPPFGKANITFVPTHKIALLTNNRPKLTSLDPAFLERLHLIPLKLSFVDRPIESFQRKRDPLLPEKLKSEASGILAWLVKGCLEWQKQGLNPPKIVLETTEKYKKDEDIIGQFLDDCTRKDPQGETKASILYDTYKLWCGNNGYRPVSNKVFGERISELFPKKGACDGNYYIGLSLKPATPEYSPIPEDQGINCF